MKSPSFTITLHREHQEFVEAAARKLDVDRIPFVRHAILKEAARVLKKPIPRAPEILQHVGRMSEITKAARAAGLTTKEFMRQAALKALGK